MTSNLWTAANSEGYPSPAALAVDPVVLTVRDGRIEVLLVHELDDRLALPGGLVRSTETAADAVQRALGEKTGVLDVYLEQLQTFTEPARDRRGWIPSVAYLALVPLAARGSSPNASWAAASTPPRLAYDHNRILELALDRVRGKLWWSNIAVGILTAPFTLTEARTVYDALGTTVHNPTTFGRDLLATGLVEPTGEKRQQPVGRPAGLYRFLDSELSWGLGRRKRVLSPGTPRSCG
jgi:8-oxo-dGTP diphosphatase